MNPYADDDVVYTVSLEGMHKSLTGMFYPSPIDTPFWTLTLSGGDWVAVNPAHIVTLKPAQGRDFMEWREP